MTFRIGCQHQRTRQQRPHAWCPGKAEEEAKKIGPKVSSPALCVMTIRPLQRRNPYHTKSDQTRRNQENAARNLHRQLILRKKILQKRNAQSSDRKHRTNAEHKEERMNQHHPAALPAIDILRKIADIQRNQRQNTGRKEGQQPLQKHTEIAQVTETHAEIAAGSTPSNARIRIKAPSAMRYRPNARKLCLRI